MAGSKKRKELRHELATIEKQIYDLETTYLEETREFGNIFTGWETYLSIEKVKTKKQITTDERLFSLSSITSPASKLEDIKKKKIEAGGVLGAGGGAAGGEVKSRGRKKKVKIEESAGRGAQEGGGVGGGLDDYYNPSMGGAEDQEEDPK